MKKKYAIVISLGVLSLLLVFKNDKEEVLVKDNVNIKNTIAMYKSEDKTNYTEIEEMPSEGYIVNEEKSYCTTDNINQVKGKVKTIDGNIVITNINKNDKCYVWFDKYIPPTGSEIILANLGTSIKTTAPTFSNAATTDEGVYATSDGMYGGTSYYWRGAATTNYLKFAGFCWRIVKINGDKTIRLIYDGTTCHPNGTSTTESIAVASTTYNSSYNQSNYVGWTYSGTSQRPSNTASGTPSNAKTQLESWYSSNISGTNAQKVAQGKYCNDRDAQLDSTWSINGSDFDYATVKRVARDNQPTLNCPSGDVYILSVGLITADEIMYAGGRFATNTEYYLYNGQHYWTMSPNSWFSSSSWALAFVLSSNGSLGGWGLYNYGGLRPVINLKVDTTFSDGDGTLNNPYVVE